MALVVAGCLSARAAAQAEDELAATVLTKAITLEQITPREAASQKLSLPAAEYEAWLLQNRTRNLSLAVIGEVMRDYVRREKLKPSDDELDAIFDKIVKEHIAGKELSADAKKKIAIQRFWALGSARDWRTAKALYEKYGGRVAISSFGAWVSFEARNTVLQEYVDRGALTFHNAELKQAFWDLARNERMAGDVFVQPQNVAERFTHPPWETFQRALAEETAKPPTEK
jgi:hypothetical protein